MTMPDPSTSSFFVVVSQVTAMFMLRSSLAVLIGVWVVFGTAWGRDRRIYRIPFADGQISKELATILKVVPFYSVLVGTAYYFQLVRFSPSGLGANLFTFLLLFVWNETWFYGLHRLLHTKRFMKIHAAHHRARVTSPFSIACFSFTEQFMHVVFALLPPILVSHHLPISGEGVAYYSLFQIFVNLLGHMNIEVYPPWFASSVVGKWFTTPTFHGLHHGRSNGHFGLLTTIPDRLFGSFFEDYPRVQARAAEGNGLTSFGERVPAPAGRRTQKASRFESGAFTPSTETGWASGERISAAISSPSSATVK
jgi:Delta7-sterol 5-desaturase